MNLKPWLLLENLRYFTNFSGLLFHFSIHCWLKASDIIFPYDIGVTKLQAGRYKNDCITLLVLRPVIQWRWLVWAGLGRGIFQSLQKGLLWLNHSSDTLCNLNLFPPLFLNFCIHRACPYETWKISQITLAYIIIVCEWKIKLHSAVCNSVKQLLDPQSVCLNTLRRHWKCVQSLISTLATVTFVLWCGSPRTSGCFLISGPEKLYSEERGRRCSGSGGGISSLNYISKFTHSMYIFKQKHS
jgi:hypothetical protein